MLQAIRTRAGGIVVKTLFALLIISFGFWGIYTRSPYYQSKSPDTVVATVGDESIRADQLQTALRPALERLRTQLGGSLDPAQVKQLGVTDTVLEQLISQSLVDQEIGRLRLDVSDDVIRAAIKQSPNFRGPDGQFDRNRFNQVLAMNGLTEDALFARLRRDLPRGDLLQAITAGARVPRPLIDALYRYRNERRVAEVVALPAADTADPGAPSDEALGKFYDAHADLFRAPELRGFTLASLAAGDIAGSIHIADDKLKAAFEERKDDFAVPEQRQIQQILAPTEDKAKEAEAALAAGKEWKEVATTIAGQNADTIDLGLFKQEDLPPQLRETVFELPLDKPSEPIKDPLGWHILRVVKIEPPSNQSFDQAKAKLTDDLVQEQAADRLEQIGNQVDDALAGGGSLADVAARFGLKLTTIAASDIGGRGPDGTPITLPVAVTDVLKTVFDTDENRTSRVTPFEVSAIFVVHTDKVTQPQVKPLAEVKTQAIAAWQAEQRAAAAKNQAATLAAAVPPGAELAKIATDKGLVATTTQPLSRRPDAASHHLPAALVAKLFTAKAGDVVTADEPTTAYVAQLKEIQAPSSTPDAEAAKLADDLGNAERFDIVGQFTDSLKQRYPVQVERAALDRLF
jgi:peptidyl-prolyl cis-trans isomerase D